MNDCRYETQNVCFPTTSKMQFNNFIPTKERNDKLKMKIKKASDERSMSLLLFFFFTVERRSETNFFFPTFLLEKHSARKLVNSTQ